jgi:hypothetical protein
MADDRCPLVLPGGPERTSGCPVAQSPVDAARGSAADAARYE